MKRILFFLTIITFLSSCKNTWSQADRDAFYEACTQEDMRHGSNKEQAKAYCDCILGKMETKYPDEMDALEHIDILAKDSDLIKCKQEVMGK